MRRTSVICVLIGLLLLSTGGNVLLARRVIDQPAATDQLEARMNAAPARPAAPAAVPVVSATPAFGLQDIAAQVASLRGLEPVRDVPIRYLGDAALRRLLTDRFNTDYLPSERETDQKLLSTLGLIDPTASVAQMLLDLLQDQVLGVYDADNRSLYLVGDENTLNATEKDTFAHEFTHALQDQHYELARFAPKHPTNDDRALAISALTEGDAMLIQRLWAQEHLTAIEQSTLEAATNSTGLLSAPQYIREQLLFPYTAGFNFVRQVYVTQNGYRGVDDVFRDPPTSTAQILHPDKYRAHIAPVDVTLDVLPGMGPGWREVKSNVFGELDLRLILQQLTDRARAVPATSGWSGDRWQLLERDGRNALISKSVWDSDAAARAFFETLGLAMQQRYFGAHQDEWSASREALTAPTASVDIRRQGTTVTLAIAADRATTQMLAVAALDPSPASVQSPPSPGPSSTSSPS